MSKSTAIRNEELLPFQVTPIVRDTCLCLHLQRAARSVARTFDLALKPVGLTNGQFSLLMSLNRPEPPLMRDVADLLAMDRTSLTAMLKPLSRRGLVEVAPDETDKRGRRLTITAEGRALLARAMLIWTETHSAIEQRLPADASADHLRGALRAIG